MLSLLLLQASPPPPFQPEVPEHPWRGWPGPGFLVLVVALVGATVGVIGGVACLRRMIRAGMPRERAMLVWPLVAAGVAAALWAIGLFWGDAAFFAVAAGLGPWPFVDDKGN